MTGRLGFPQGRTLLVDVSLVGLFVMLLVDRELLGIGTPADVAGSAWWTLPLFLGGDLMLLVRRSHPVTAVVAFYGAYSVHALVTGAGVEGAFALFPAMCGLYSLGRYSSGRHLVAGLLGVVAFSALHDSHDPGLRLSNDAEVWSYLTWMMVQLLFLVLGLLVRTVGQATANRRAIAEAERLRANAVASERAKIARDLHDVVTHNVNVVVMQAMAASGVLDSDPHRVRAPLEAIESSGREALAEMRRMLGVLREEDGPALAPQPGVVDIVRLTETLQHAGQRVSCSIDPAADGLPDGMGMVLYRIAQEALTNAMKHARGSDAVVVVRRTPTEVELEVSNSSGEPEAHPSGAGHGLIGMAERAALFGGHVETGPLLDGGFRVRAVLPLAAT